MSTPTDSSEPESGSPKSGETVERTPERVSEFHRLREKYVRQMQPLAESIDRSQRLSWTDLMTVINC